MNAQETLEEILGHPITTRSRIEAFVVDVGPQEATNLLSNNFKRQRALRPTLAKRFETAANEDYFQEGSPIRVAREGRRLVLVDGQHRLNAIIRANCTIPLTIIVTNCDAASEYAIADSIAGGGRTTADAVLALNEGLAGTSNLTVRMWSSALVVVANRLDTAAHQSVSRQRVAELYELYEKDISELAELLGPPAPALNMFRAASMAVMLLTYHYQKEKAKAFWKGVRDDDGLHRGDPRKELLNWINKGGGRGNASRRELAAACAKCWNAWMRGDTIGQVRVKDMETLIGVPEDVQ